MKINKILMNMLLLISFIKIFTLTSFADSDKVVINDWILSLSGTEVTMQRPVSQHNIMNLDLDYTVNNDDLSLKNGDELIKTMTMGPFPEGIEMNGRVFAFSIVGVDGVNYGALNVANRSVGTSSGTMKYVDFIFTFNANIENTKSFNGKVEIPASFTHNNRTFNIQSVPINVKFGNIEKVLGSRSVLLNELGGGEGVFSLGPSLNRMFADLQLHSSRLRALGRPNEPLLETYNTKASIYSDSPSRSMSSIQGLRIRINYPIAENANDMRLSSQQLLAPSPNNWLTRIYPNPGETWNDFKNRVYAVPYSYGHQFTSQGWGTAINVGDFTKNGWKDGQVKIWDTVAGTNNITELANRYRTFNFDGIRLQNFIQIYGPEGRMKGGIPYMYLRPEAVYPNYENTNRIGVDFEYIYNESDGNLVVKNRRIEGNVPSVSSTIYVPESSSVVRVLDKDTSELLENVRISLDKKIDNSWVRQVTNVNSDNTGIASFLNLLPGDYRVVITGYPTGYQNKVTWKRGHSNTSVNSSGEFSLVNKGSATVVAELEKIKSQAVDFTVRDTASKVIVGESFNIYRNGARIVTYTTNSQGKFSVPSLPSGEYALLPDNPLRTGTRAFVIEEGKSNTLEVEAVLPVIPEITANGPSSLNLGNVNIGQVTRSTIPLDVTYRGDNGYTVTARQSSNTNIDFELNDTLITTQEKEFTNLNGTSNPITTMINYQLNAKTNSNSIKGQQSTNIIFSFKYKL